jgi:hypothetical protein
MIVYPAWERDPEECDERYDEYAQMANYSPKARDSIPRVLYSKPLN